MMMIAQIVAFMLLTLALSALAARRVNELRMRPAPRVVLRTAYDTRAPFAPRRRG